MADIETVAFQSGGSRCEADLHLPADREPPWPVVVMAHGFGAARSWGLARFAERFVREGMAAFVFDHRGFGTSTGEPRRWIDPGRQLADWAEAVSSARSLERVDPRRVALWGTSFSGGHVLATATGRDDIAAVVAQVPFVDGPPTIAQEVRRKGAGASARQIGLALGDRAAGLVGREPVEVPIVSRPGEGGLLDTPGALQGYRALVPASETMVNRTPARVVLALPFYRPGRRAEGIDAPVHVVLAGEDRLLPPAVTEELVDRLQQPSVHRVPTGHFDVYQPPWFATVADREAAFLAEALEVDG